LWSFRPAGWRQNQPEVYEEVYENGGLDFDLVAPFRRENVWIIECSGWSRIGSFESAGAEILAATVIVTPVADQEGDGVSDGFDVEYESPNQGAMTFGWHSRVLAATGYTSGIQWS
jgi:hypothetical protein